MAKGLFILAFIFALMSLLGIRLDIDRTASQQRSAANPYRTSDSTPAAPGGAGVPGPVRRPDSGQ